METLPREIAEKVEEVRGLCERYGVKRLAIFGSAVKGTFDPATSDVDFVVEFAWDPDPLVRGRRWLDLWDELKTLFGRDIDLLVDSTVENPYIRAAIDREHIDLYAA